MCTLVKQPNRYVAVKVKYMILKCFKLWNNDFLELWLWGCHRPIKVPYTGFSPATNLVHGPILILVPIRGTKDDCCELIAHKVEIENLYDNLSVGVAFKIFFSCKSAGNDL